MSRTTFRNASGLPNSGQMTTARDMATLGRALQEHHPEYFSYFSTPSFVWQGRRIRNHDHLLGRVTGVNGIKTGYTRASGFNLVTSVTRGNRQIVGVVIGGETSRWRDNHMAQLIATYLPKASTGRHTAFVPGATSGGRRDRPQDAADPAAAPGHRRRQHRLDRQRRRRRPVVLADQPRPQPAERPRGRPRRHRLAGRRQSIFALAAVDDASRHADRARATPPARTISSDAASPTTVITGWKIQLAATPTQSSAEDILDQALSKGIRRARQRLALYRAGGGRRQRHALPRPLRRVRRQERGARRMRLPRPGAISNAWRSATDRD